MYKENKFVSLVRICLMNLLFDFLFNCKYYKINNNNLLYCCKNLTNIFFPLFIKNKMIRIDVAGQWPEKKRNFVKLLLINDDVHLKYLLSFTNLIQLTFGTYFNQPLTRGVLPSTLIKLTFGYCFNKPLKCGVFPSTLSQLTFGSNFNQPLTREVLPSTLNQLTFGYSFDQH